MRATGHGISAGVGKLGAFIGVFLFPVLASSLGLRGTLLLTAGVSAGGLLLTLVLPEPARRSLEEVSSGEAELNTATVPALIDPDAPIILDAKPDTPPDRAA
jgi:MFS transporter, PHS family, inorganic phosphate transporter